MPDAKRPATCSLCGGRAIVRHQRCPGYQAPQVFQVWHCTECQVGFVLPRVTDAALYELIYQNRALIPGYARYARYAEQVKAQPNPLDFLANAEDVYWAVARHLRARREREPLQLRVLDYGCGLGYLTYALARDGFAATGYDGSRVAAAEATRMFGPCYVSEEWDSFLEANWGAYDVVVMAEVIEHVDDVLTFLARMLTLLAPGGEIVMTTPNKSNWGEAAVWQTELPPVHLWWFSEESQRRIAASLGCEVAFMDFSEFNSGQYRVYRPDDSGGLSRMRPVFSADGKIVITPRSWAVVAFAAMKDGVKRVLAAIGMLRPLSRMRDSVLGHERYGSRSYSMLRRPEEVSDLRALPSEGAAGRLG